MRSTAIERKAIGYDILINIITLSAIALSYYYSITILCEEIEETIKNVQLLKNIFVFIVPAALEGMNIFISVANENKRQDKIDLGCSFICIIISVLLFILLIIDATCCSRLFAIVVLVYPVRIMSSIVFDVMKLKERR